MALRYEDKLVLTPHLKMRKEKFGRLLLSHAFPPFSVNEDAGRIIDLVDGSQTVNQIIEATKADLEVRGCDTTGAEKRILKFLEICLEGKILNLLPDGAAIC